MSTFRAKALARFFHADRTPYPWRARNPPPCQRDRLGESWLALSAYPVGYKTRFFELVGSVPDSVMRECFATDHPHPNTMPARALALCTETQARDRVGVPCCCGNATLPNFQSSARNP